VPSRAITPAASARITVSDPSLRLRRKASKGSVQDDGIVFLKEGGFADAGMTRGLFPSPRLPRLCVSAFSKQPTHV